MDKKEKFDIISNSNSEVKKLYFRKKKMKIKIGDKLPSSELFYLDQNNEVKKIDISDLCKGKTIILGMPGAFTKTCSALHLPGYIKNYELASKKEFQKLCALLLTILML